MVSITSTQQGLPCRHSMTLGHGSFRRFSQSPFSTGLRARRAPGHPASPSEESPAHGNCTKWNPKWMSGWNIVPKMKACRSDLRSCVSVPKPFFGATQGVSLKKSLLFLSAICPSPWSCVCQRSRCVAKPGPCRAQSASPSPSSPGIFLSSLLIIER